MTTDWQPISTAPKDEVILVGHGPVDDIDGHVIAAYDNGEPDWCWAVADGEGSCFSRAAFTHWMPLPPPPAVGS